MRQWRRDRDPQVVGKLPLGHLDPRHRLPHAMAHEHTLRTSGRAARVDNGAQVVETHVGGYERRRLELVGEGEIVVADVVGPEPEHGEVWILRLELRGRVR